MYDYMDVDFNDKKSLEDAMKHYETLSELSVEPGYMALGTPVTERLQDHDQHLHQAHTYALAIIKLYEYEERDRQKSAKKSFWKKLFRK